MSVFLAIDLSAEVREQLAGLIETHRASREAKWLRPDKLHLTLVFLGNPKPPRIDELRPLIDRLALGRAPFSLRLRGAGVFVTRRAPSVLWLGVEGDVATLRALQAEAAATLGDEPREYAPHVTLGRAHEDGGFDGIRDALAHFESAPFAVRHLTLYESTHHQYHVLHRADFDASVGVGHGDDRDRRVGAHADEPQVE
ncbi:MAG: RNA 2',3'-cyclic phosphodiesterase [Myxococcota bacterium]